MTLGAAALGTALLAGPTVEAPPAPTGATMPLVHVELSLAPPAATPVWVDVAHDFQSIETRRGRQRELDRYQAGTFTVVLENSDGDYDPLNTASPYNGHLKPMRRLRVRSTYGGATYPVIDGYIDSIDQEYEGPNVARAVITATDAFKVLAAAELPPSAYAAEVRADGPAHWWRLDEPAAAGAAIDQIGGATATNYGTGVFGADTLLSRDPGGAWECVTGTNYLEAPVPVATGVNPSFTVELVIASADALHGGQGIFAGLSHGPAGVTIGFHAGGTRIEGKVFDGAGTTYTASGDYPAAANTTCHVALVAAAGVLTIYVDGVAGSTTVAYPAVTWPDVGETRIGGGDYGMGGVYDEVAVYDYALSPARIAAHAAAVATPWNDDLPGARATRVLDVVSWPADRRNIDAGVSVLQSADLETSALDHLQKVAESEFGALFIGAAGEVRFISRHNLRNRDELYTFSDHPVAAGHLPYTGHRPEYGDGLIRNEATVSRSEGTAQTVRNETSIDEYLVHSYTLDGLIYDTDDLSRSAAEWIVAEYAEPVRRISELTVSPREQEFATALFPAVLGLELADEATVIERPPGPVTNTQDSVVEGIAHRIGPLFWETTFNLSPAGTDSYWQIGVPGHSEIGVTTRVGF